jgi:hypothetical protein
VPDVTTAVEVPATRAVPKATIATRTRSRAAPVTTAEIVEPPARADVTTAAEVSSAKAPPVNRGTTISSRTRSRAKL